MIPSGQPHSLFDIRVIPPHQFHLISPMAPFTKGQKREALVFAHFVSEGEQINLLIKHRESSDIAGSAVVRAHPSEMAMVDFYVLERYRKRGAGRTLFTKVESLARDRGISTLTTGKSLHSDNTGMIEFCKRMGFARTPLEIHHFSQALSAQKERISRFGSEDLSRFLPKNNRIFPFAEDLFESVYETAQELLADDPFYSEPLIYQTLLLSSEKYSNILIEEGRVNGFAIFFATGNNLHLNFVAIRSELHHLGLPILLIGTGLHRAYRDGKTTFSYIAYKTDKLFRDIRQVFRESDFTIIQMEKELQ